MQPLIVLTMILAVNLQTDDWQLLAPGMEYRIIMAKQKSIEGDSRITVVRIDPHQWDLVFTGRSLTGDRFGKTAREWSESNNLTAVTNAGMFDIDNSTHTGYLRYREHVNSRRLNNYKSLLAFDPKEGRSVPPFRIFDLDEPGITIQSVLEDYSSVIQNLRLIKKPGINVWSKQDDFWSEAAIGEDKEGRILFIYSRSPFSMYQLNRELLESGIGIVAAQHLEGGPEAQLYLRTGEFEMELFGSYETSWLEDDSNPDPWPVPNVIGVKPKK
ncbi:MAG: phosphodiester glycosidase family protein [Bacteroidales bacterium]|nr:phosphodiester glycosidase family protein [Bacteroidales bacterium]